MSTTLQTRFGTARLTHEGYFRISSKKEGNRDKFLHKLIYESIWGKLPKNWNIHHIDGNKTNNCILNLIGLPKSYHNSLHKKGNGNPNYNKKGKDSYNFGRKMSENTKINISKTISQLKNTSGYYRVSIRKCNDCKQGFVWRYRYMDNTGKRKTIESVNLQKLEEKVKSKGLVWEEISKK